ncbi:hypothetical protein INR49_000356 [Caranx melampygus]|nr:hypothetical protein INR49_000356 [Caranx melampygus]
MFEGPFLSVRLCRVSTTVAGWSDNVKLQQFMWLHASIAASMEGEPISALCTPAMVVDVDKVKRNAQRMIERYQRLGVERCAALSERLDLFQVLLDHPDALEQLKKRPLRDGRQWHVWLKLDCGNGRAGVLHSELGALTLAQAIAETEGVQLTGVYAHCGNTYNCRGAEQIQAVAQETTTLTLQFMEKLKAVGITCKSSIGSTPSCSHPIKDMAQLSEVHPGNYVFYANVFTKVMVYYFITPSLDGAGKLPTGFAVIEGHPDLKLLSMTQEHGRVEPISGPLDYSKYPLGTLLTLIPYHSCATAMMHPVYHVHSEGRLLGRWTPILMSVLEVKFVGDGDVLEHIVDKQEGLQSSGATVQKMVTFKKPAARRPREDEEGGDGDENGACDEQNYIQALGADNTEEDEEGLSRVAGSSIFTFQKAKRGHSMAQTASELARTPGKSVTFSKTPNIEPSTPTRTGRNNRGESRTPQRNKKVQFVSTTPHRLRKRMTTPSLRSDSDSELSPSGSEEDEDEDGIEDEQKIKKEDKENVRTPRTPSKGLSAALYKTPAKKSKITPEPLNQPSMVEEYFEAHGSSKVLTSDRTLERLHTPKLDRETLVQLLEGKRSCYYKEIQQLHSKHRKHFSKWMLQLQLGFSVLVYGLGSKKTLLEDFRVSHLAQEIHLVVNGFFPSITLKSCVHTGPDLHVYLIIHNIDGPMLRGEKTQSALGQLASIPNLHLVASLDHINAPLVWDQFKQSQFNWLWWECVTFQHYTEETSYENSLLVQQTGALALSSLTHVLRSLTPNARGIFKLLVKFQLENKDDPSYTGLSFQDFYQRCREAFLVNSDLTLRTQLTEFRDHKLIRTRKGADGVEYLIVAVDASTLMDFLENEEGD